MAANMTGTLLKTFLASTNIKYKNKTIYNSCLIFQAIMAFYERKCTIGAFVHPVPKKLIFHRHSPFLQNYRKL